MKKVIVCIANNNGISFNNRRVSSDRRIMEDIATGLGNDVLYLDERAAGIFSDYLKNDRVIIKNDIAAISSVEKDWIFWDRGALEINSKNTDRVVIYRFNRDYPADAFLSFDKQCFRCLERTDFTGNSHDRITKEVWINENA